MESAIQQTDISDAMVISAYLVNTATELIKCCRPYIMHDIK